MSASSLPPPLTVTIQVPNQAPFEVNIPNGRNPTCEVKRIVSSKFQISPLLQRTSLEGGANVDSFTAPPTIKVELRTNKRVESKKLVVLLMSEKRVEGVSQATVQVDPTDSVLDLKFILAEKLGVLPDYQRIFYRTYHMTNRQQLRDSQPLASCNGIFDDPRGEIRLMFEMPSGAAGHGNIHFTMPKLLERRSPQLQTMGDIFLNTVKTHGDRPFLGTRSYLTPGKNDRGPYEWLTYAQAGVRVGNIVAGLKTLGLQQKESIGIISPNRSEWTLTDMACNVSGFVSVPLYDTLGPDAIQFIINHSSIRAVVASVKELKALHAVKSVCPSLEIIIAMDDGVNDKLALQNVPKEYYTHTFSQLEALGAKNIAQYPFGVSVTKPNDILTICYTSGTTGNPKGAVLSHANIVAASNAIDERAPEDERSPDEVLFSYLPLAHIYERVLQAGMISFGGALGFSQGDPLKLLEDVGALKPTLFPGVPRVWDRIYSRVQQQVEEGGMIKSMLFNRAYKSKFDALVAGDVPKNGKLQSMWDSIVFSKIAAALGGRVKLMASGAAPLRPEVGAFMRCAFMSHFVEGYGLTETGAALTCGSRGDTTYGHVGTPLDCNYVKLVDVPDMGYTSKDTPFPRGEVWVSGPNVFQGYYKQPDVTNEVMQVDSEGRTWFCTGDIGMWLPDGSLKIFDRKKAIFKLAQGEYIRAEHIEGVYKQTKELANIFVHGDSKETYLVAIVIPEPTHLQTFCAAQGIKGPPSEQVKDPRVQKWLHDLMEATGKKQQLRGFEFVKRIHLTTEEFSVENGLMTPTFKLKRNIAAKYFSEPIAKMYAQGEAVAAKIKAKL